MKKLPSLAASFILFLTCTVNFVTFVSCSSKSSKKKSSKHKQQSTSREDPSMESLEQFFNGTKGGIISPESLASMFAGASGGTVSSSVSVGDGRRIGRYKFVEITAKDLKNKKIAENGGRKSKDRKEREREKELEREKGIRSSKHKKYRDSDDSSSVELDIHFTRHDKISEVSTASDETPPRDFPHASFANVLRNDHLTQQSAVALNYMCTFPDELIRKHIDDPNVIIQEARSADFFSHHNESHDGYMTAGAMEVNKDTWRIIPIHPERKFYRFLEIDPTVPQYDRDVIVAQKSFKSHLGRPIGRDGRKKTFPNRDTFSSCNDGCCLM